MNGIDMIVALNDMDDWMISDAKAVQKRAPRFLEWGAVAVCVVCMILFGGMSMQRLLHLNDTEASSTAALASAPEEMINEDPLGDFLPSIRIRNRVYYWRGLSVYGDTQSVADRIEVPGSGLITVLPKGFEETGTINRVDQQEPERDYDMAAAFEVSGVVYENPECPEVIYARIKTDWIDNLYVRFTTEKLGNGDRISFHGNLYQYTAGSNLQETLPDGYINVGTLTYVGADQLPDCDLETNYLVNGAALYANEDHPEVVYVENTRHWQGGTKVSYEECRRIWCTITSGDNSLVLSVPEKFSDHILLDTSFDYKFPVAEYNLSIPQTIFACYIERNEDDHMDGLLWFIEAEPRYGDGEYIPPEFVMAMNYRLLGSDENYSYLIWYPGLPAGECFDFWNLQDAEAYLQMAEDSIPILEGFITDNGLEEYPGWQNAYQESAIQDARQRVEYLRKSSTSDVSSSVAANSNYQCATLDVTTEEVDTVEVSFDG